MNDDEDFSSFTDESIIDYEDESEEAEADPDESPESAAFLLDDEEAGRESWLGPAASRVMEAASIVGELAAMERLSIAHQAAAAAAQPPASAPARDDARAQAPVSFREHTEEHMDADPHAYDAVSGLPRVEERSRSVLRVSHVMSSAPLSEVPASTPPYASIAATQVSSPEESPSSAVSDVMRRHLRGLIEALLFASDRPLKAADLAEIARADSKLTRGILDDLSVTYRAEGRGFQLDELAGGWQLRTSATFAPFVRELTAQRPVKLTRAQIETLSIVAYRQPITRPEIEDIRGVDAGAVLKLLLDRDLVRVIGKKDEPGRPLLYGTTNQFLTFFGLKSLRDLPTLREFTELTDESKEVVERELGDVLPDGPREPPPTIGDPRVAPADVDPFTSDAGGRTFSP